MRHVARGDWGCKGVGGRLVSGLMLVRVSVPVDLINFTLPFTCVYADQPLQRVIPATDKHVNFPDREGPPHGLPCHRHAATSYCLLSSVESPRYVSPFRGGMDLVLSPLLDPLGISPRAFSYGSGSLLIHRSCV